MDDARSWRDPTRKGIVVHHSARGDLKRNAGNFTRGSQLFTHEFLMWLAGVRIPFYIFLGVFVVAVMITSTLRLHEHELQLIGMKLYSDFWSVMEFSPGKVANLTLPNGTIIGLPMLNVGMVPAVQHAWDTMVRCLLGSAFASAFIAVPINVWFVDFSRTKGRHILEERHERGAMLVDAMELHATITSHNRIQRASDLVRLQREIRTAGVEKDHRRRQIGRQLHRPYTIAGIPYPWRTEQSHTMLIGTTGSGKTTALKRLITQMRKRGHRAVIFDITGTFVESFYDPKTDVILNPSDKRCPSWSLFSDCFNKPDFTAAAEALIEKPHTGDPFWQTAAQTLLVSMCLKLMERGFTTNRDLVEQLLKADLKTVHRWLSHTMAHSLTSPDVARLAESVRAVLVAFVQCLEGLPEDAEPFSITEWINADKKRGSILFVTSTHDQLSLYRPLLTLWMNTAVNRVMQRPRTRDLQTWFLFDEVHALHRLPAIENGMQTARGFGGAFVLGIHSFAKLAETYGENGAKNLASLARTKLILATADRETAEECSAFIGHREVRQMDESYSYGNNNARDAATITPRREVQPLVLPDDITNLPSLKGFLKFPDGFDAARIALRYVDYPTVAPGFMPALLPQTAPPAKPPAALPVEIAAGDPPETENGGRESTYSPKAIPEGQMQSLMSMRREFNFFDDADRGDYFQANQYDPQQRAAPAQTRESHILNAAEFRPNDTDQADRSNTPRDLDRIHAIVQKPVPGALEAIRRELEADAGEDRPARHGGHDFTQPAPEQTIADDFDYGPDL